MDKVIYSANYWGLGKDRKIDYGRIERAVRAGFKFIYLQTDRDVLLQRNKDRVANQKYDDASGSFDWYLSVYEDMKEKNYFAYEINTNQPIEKISSSLIIFLENSAV
jgi:gluconate kinase